MILYFSGTGNTRRAATLLSEALGDTDLRRLTPQMLLDPASARFDMSVGDTRVVWAFPTYSWGIPPVVAAVMRGCMAGQGFSDATHYMLATCGDDIAYTDRQWRRIMKARGFRAGGAFSVVMPNNYVLMKGFDTDSDEVAARKLAEAPDAIRRIADAIRDGGADIAVRLRFSRIKSSVIYPSFVRYAMSPRPFGSNEGCVSCGKCAASCPMDNIAMKDGRPVWGTHCAMCLRCYHICPRHAVTYGKATDGKGQYFLE
ncbi:MAG: EFR1 family ferrodoxin [Muribaculaceae bacterium]|nr:EFR1 family ferrodoxin [Muribaculaceae bacterium]MDE6197075.1 EFR1 family ferrodoxin [Muribaculaceae bacterium]